MCQSAENGDLVVPHDLLCSGVVAAGSLQAESFRSGDFRLYSADAAGIEVQRLDGAIWREMVTFVADGSMRVNTIRGAGAARLTCDDSLHVGGALTVSGSLPSPFFLVGKISSECTTVTSSGRVGFSPSRSNDAPAGSYKVTFDESHPLGENYVFNVYVENRPNEAFAKVHVEETRHNYLRFIITDSSNNYHNRPVHVMIH